MWSKRVFNIQCYLSWDDIKWWCKINLTWWNASFIGIYSVFSSGVSNFMDHNLISRALKMFTFHKLLIYQNRRARDILSATICVNFLISVDRLFFLRWTEMSLVSLLLLHRNVSVQYQRNTLAWPLGFIILQQGIGNAAVSQKAVKPTTIVNSSLDQSRDLRSHSQGS